MISGPFLTDLDSERLKLKGSRDPLGIQSIWVRFGRHVVGNLSTVSNSVRDFTILIFGYHFAEQVAEAAGSGTELATFLKWEQLAGYARASVNKETGFRGTERVGRNLETGTVTLSAETRHQILSSQKLYGLWGLYTVPGRSSGLLDGDPARLTIPARQLVEEYYLPKLSAAGMKDGKQIVEMLGKVRVRLDAKGADCKLLTAIASLLRWDFNTRERTFYREHLLYGGPKDPTDQRQRQLAELLAPKLSDGRFPWSSPALHGLAKEAEGRGEAWHPLAGRLHRIALAETLLAPSSALFIHLLGCHDVSLTDIAKRLQRAWGSKLHTLSMSDLPELQAELGGGDEPTGERWLAIARAMSAGDYQDLIRLLLAQNRAVMQIRGGASAWIEEQNGRLNVRMPEERGGLPAREELPRLWRFSYFLDSLYAVESALKENQHD